MNNSGESMNIL